MRVHSLNNCPGFAETESQEGHGLQAINSAESARTPDLSLFTGVSQTMNTTQCKGRLLRMSDMLEPSS